MTATFTLAVALVAIPMGLASSRWGGRTLFLAAALFLAGSLILAVAGSYEWLLAGRFVQGLGAGAGIPVGTALITSYVAPAWRHRAFGLFGAGTGLGTVFTLLPCPHLPRPGDTNWPSRQRRSSASRLRSRQPRSARFAQGRSGSTHPTSVCSAERLREPFAAERSSWSWP